MTEARVAPLTLVGTGALRTAIEGRLDPRSSAPAVLAVSDGWDVPLLDRAAADADAAGVPFLGVHVEMGRVLIGPLVRPGVPGCRRCVATRRAAVDPRAAAQRAALLARHGPRLAEPSGWLTAFAVAAVAGIVAAEMSALAAGRAPRTQHAVVVVELDNLVARVRRLLPDPLCEVCGGLPADRRDAAAFRPVSRPTSGPGELRAARLTDRAAELRRTYVDGFAGLVAEVREVDAAGLPVAYAVTGRPGTDRQDAGIGRATDRGTAGLAAILEAVERRAGALPSGRRAALRARYADVAACAVDPRTLGLPEPATSGAVFDPDREIAWVWGHSFGRGEPVLVPRSAAYFGADDRHETSNGCALGSCVEEAAVHGLLEVAERDAFLLTWYARMPVPRVALESARSPRIRLLAERLERVHGYRTLVFDTSLEHGIPSVLLLAVDAARAPDRPAVMCAAAAHPDPERACWAALGELALVVARQVRAYPPERERAAAMVADPDLVRVMDDHVLLYGHPDTLPRWDFLIGAGRRDEEASFAEAFRGRPELTGDLRDDLLGLVDRYRCAGMDVVMVDQTGPEQRAGGVSAVKVLIPGTLPMTFGHHNRRLHGLPRLRTVPARLGHAAAPLNPHPHPFS